LALSSLSLAELPAAANRVASKHLLSDVEGS